MATRSAAIAAAAALAGIFAWLLTAAFIALRLLHTITWPWWWVVSPLPITAALTALFIAGMVAVAAVAAYRDTH